MRAIVTVTGIDRTGIVASVATMLSEMDVNILDVSQTVMQEFFTMVMMVDTSKCTMEFADLSDKLKQLGEQQHLSIRIQREDIFNAMHRI